MDEKTKEEKENKNGLDEIIYDKEGNLRKPEEIEQITFFKVLKKNPNFIEEYLRNHKINQYKK